MRRAVATERLAELLGRVIGGGFYVDHVRVIFVFGSYAAGSLEPGDIDLDIEFDMSDELHDRQLRDLFDHRDPHIDFRQELRGSRRCFEIHFNDADKLAAEPGFNLTPIFKRGDGLDDASRRLAAITADPNSTATNRDAVIAELIGLEKLVTRPERILLQELLARNAITVERLTLDEHAPSNPDTRFRVEHTWNEANPKRRAALAAAACLETLGADELLAGLPGKPPLHDDSYAHRAYFGIGAVERALHALANDAQIVLAVYNETRKAAPLHALKLRRHNLSGEQLRALMSELGV